MTKKTKSNRSYDVGYGKPPKANQFQPGQSGNMRGRPKKPRSSNAILDAVLGEEVTATIKGRQRKITKKEVIIRQLVNDGMKGIPRALKAIFDFPSERVMDEEARKAQEIKDREQFDAEFDDILEKIRKKAAAAKMRADANQSKAEESPAADLDKVEDDEGS